ncbi:MAG: GNAT family N-acetyltransferase [Bacteroidales bacterium]|jgi:diamine N-acetyltransferase|nr:GNAT family N-acetyltransferase [Bacteroidales bacterium]MDD4086639.1 GNAT family N-acetyltransferase [Bacteroidales bacterium]MDY0086199.1 GNAT family N-acetyltransferase [Bacteroidales bacterium]
MFIQDDILKLRAAEPSDAALIYQWENDMQIWRVSDTIMPYSMYQIEQFLINNTDLYSQKQLRIMIELQESNQAAGCIDYYDFDPFHERIGIGILIASEFRGKNIAINALKLSEQYIFGRLHLNQIYCLIGEDNQASLQLFLKAGYTQCGLRKAWLKTPKGFMGQYEFQKINPDRRFQFIGQ